MSKHCRARVASGCSLRPCNRPVESSRGLCFACNEEHCATVARFHALKALHAFEDSGLKRAAWGATTVDEADGVRFITDVHKQNESFIRTVMPDLGAFILSDGLYERRDFMRVLQSTDKSLLTIRVDDEGGFHFVLLASHDEEFASYEELVF